MMDFELWISDFGFDEFKRRIFLKSAIRNQKSEIPTESNKK